MKHQWGHDTAKALGTAQLPSFELCESDMVKTIDFKFCHVKTRSFVSLRKAPEERLAPKTCRHPFLTIVHTGTHQIFAPLMVAGSLHRLRACVFSMLSYPQWEGLFGFM